MSGVGRGGGAFESCAVTEGVVPERQSIFGLLESFTNSFYICIVFPFCKFKSSSEIFKKLHFLYLYCISFFVNLNPVLKYLKNYGQPFSILILFDFHVFILLFFLSSFLFFVCFLFRLLGQSFEA